MILRIEASASVEQLLTVPSAHTLSSLRSKLSDGTEHFRVCSQDRSGPASHKHVLTGEVRELGLVRVVWDIAHNDTLTKERGPAVRPNLGTYAGAVDSGVMCLECSEQRRVARCLFWLPTEEWRPSHPSYPAFRRQS